MFLLPQTLVHNQCYSLFIMLARIQFFFLHLRAEDGFPVCPQFQASVETYLHVYCEYYLFNVDYSIGRRTL